MKRLFALVFFCALLCLSCKKHNNSEVKSDLVFTAIAGECYAAQKATFDKNEQGLSVSWVAGDLLAITEGVNIATYKADNDGKESTFGMISGAALSEGSSVEYTAYYPASYFNDGVFVLPSEQIYRPNGVEVFPMVARSSATNLAFNSVCSLLEVKLSARYCDGAKVSFLTLESSGESLCGSVSYDFGTDNVTVDGSNELSLVCNDPVTLGIEPVSFIFAIPPGVYETGFKLTVHALDGANQMISTSVDMSVRRSYLYSTSADYEGGLVYFTGIIDEPQLTKTVISPYQNCYKIDWGKCDQISINADPSYYSLEGGSNIAHFVTSNSEEVRANASSPYYLAYYPLSMFSQNTGASPYLNADQTRPFFEVPTLPMVASSDNSELHFKYIAGLVKLSLKTVRGKLDASRISFGADKPLSGNFKVSGDTFSMTGNFGDIIVRNAGVVDDVSESDLFVTIPYGRFDSLSVTVSDPAGAVMTYPLGSFEISAGQYRELAIEVDPYDYIPDNYIYYTTSDGCVVTPYKLTPVSNEYNERGAMIFEKSVQTIVSNAFDNTDGYAMGADKLTSVRIPRTVVSFGNYAFRSCSMLKELDLSDNIGMTSVPAGFCMNCSALEKVLLPESVTKINNNAFQNCSSLSEINIPDGIHSLPQNTFASCSSLRQISLPDDFIEFGVKVFMASGIVEIDIPQGVTTLSSQLFQDCKSLSQIRLHRFTREGEITSYANNALKNCTALQKIIVPEGAAAAYKAAPGWSDFQHLIVEEQ